MGDNFLFTLGPGAYRPEESTRAIYRSSPSYTFGTQFNCPVPSQTPGPGTYSPANFRAYKPEAPHYSLGSRHAFCRAPFLINDNE